jgi:hypothetical protein
MADFAKLPELLKQARAELGKSAGVAQSIVEEKSKEEPKQLNLF